MPNIPIKIIDYEETHTEYSSITDESQKDENVLNPTTIYNTYTITDEMDTTSTTSPEESQQNGSSD